MQLGSDAYFQRRPALQKMYVYWWHINSFTNSFLAYMASFAIYFRPLELSSAARRLDRLITYNEFFHAIHAARGRFHASGYQSHYRISIVYVLISPIRSRLRVIIFQKWGQSQQRAS